MSDVIKNRYDFVLYFDVENGNPNGDPDAGNMPRVDLETGYGLVTDVCLKRKIRNYVELAREGKEGFDIYIRAGKSLNDNDFEALEANSLLNEKGKPDKKKIGNADKSELTRQIRLFMCAKYYDVRTFGAVMTQLGGTNSLGCGQLRGPVQMTFSKSVDPVFPQEMTITRVTWPDREKAESGNPSMGRKYIIPYGLYRCEGFVSANLARKTTGFSEDDLELLWEAIENMFEHDRSAARGLMAVRSLIVFKHDSELGCAPAHKLFDAVTCKKREGVEVPRSFSDYEGVYVDETQVPEGVEVIKRV